MPLIEVDFETFKEITRRRPSEGVSDGDVVREALGLSPPVETSGASEGFWESEGVKFPIGSILEHKFRDGKLATAIVRPNGLEVKGQTYSGLSPAGVAVTGHQLNGWLFWFVRKTDGTLEAADTLRKK